MVQCWGHAVTEDQLNALLIVAGEEVTEDMLQQLYLHDDLMTRLMERAGVYELQPRRILLDDNRRGWVFAFKVSCAVFDDKLPERMPRGWKEEVSRLNILLQNTEMPTPAWYQGYRYDPDLEGDVWRPYRRGRRSQRPKRAVRAADRKSVV